MEFGLVFHSRIISALTRKALRLFATLWLFQQAFRFALRMTVGWGQGVGRSRRVEGFSNWGRASGRWPDSRK